MVNIVATPSVMLFVPGDRPDRFAKAAASGADKVILDLEDAVSADKKAEARAAVARHSLPAKSVVIRVNGRKSPEFDEDMSALDGTSFATIMLPKTESMSDIDALQKTLNRTVTVIPLIETAAGVANLSEILQTPGVMRAGIGEIDLSLDLGCSSESALIQFARCQLVLQSRAKGLLPPLDGVTATLDDDVSIERAARSAMEMGFGGKLAIHPRQVEPIRRGFQATAQQVSWAQKVLSAANGATGAVRSPDGEMIDAPVIAKAKRILHEAGLKADQRNQECGLD